MNVSLKHILHSEAHLDIIHSFERSAKSSFNKTAVITKIEQFSYEHLDKISNNLAFHLIHNIKVKKQDRIGINLPKSFELCAVLLGVLKAGCVYVPMDPKYPRDRLAMMAEDANLNLIINLEGSLETFGCKQHLPISRSFLENLPVALETNFEEPGNDDLAYIIFTSGSTGRPKGVMVKRSNLSHFINCMGKILNINNHDRLYSLTPISFDIFGLEFFLPLCFNATVIFADNSLLGNPSGMWSELNDLEATIVQATPAFYHLAFEAGNEYNLSLRHVLCGGESWDINLAKKIFAMTPPKCQLWNMYGPTETTIWSLYKEITRDSQKIHFKELIGDTTAYIFDENFNPAIEGELFIGGPGVATGYWGNSTLTQDRFIEHPTSEERLYKTGDLVRKEDNGIVFISRLDNQVKLRGFRIELGDIEENLTCFPQIKRAVATVIKNSDHERLVAFLEVKNNVLLSINDIREHIMERLPSYMCPEDFLVLEDFPQTPNGKIDRKALVERYAFHEDPKEDVQNHSVEGELRKLWSEVLQVPFETITVSDHFFKRGGHSLMIAKLLSRMRRSFEISLKMDDIFQNLVFEQQIQLIHKKLSISSHTIYESKERKDGLPEVVIPATYAQIAEYETSLTPNARAVHLPSTWRIYGNLNVEALEKAFKYVIECHESLRTSFIKREGKIYQIINANVTFSIIHRTRHDLAFHDQRDFQNNLNQLFDEEESYTFEINSAPLLRIMVIEISPKDHLLFMTIHHAITDGWSKSIILQQVSKTYNELINNTFSNAVSLPKQYQDFVKWQQSYLESKQYEEDRDTWINKLTNYNEYPLEGDQGVIERKTYRGEVKYKTVKLSSNSIDDLAKSIGVTPFAVILCAFYNVLYKFSNFHKKRFIVSTDSACRYEEGFEEVTGLLMNTSLIDAEIRPETSFIENIKILQAALYETLETQALPFEKLLEDLRERGVKTTQLGEVQIIYQNIPAREWQLGQLKTEKLKRYPKFAGLSFIFECSINNDGQLDIALEYSTEMYSEAFILNFISNFENILLTGIADSCTTITSLISERV